MQNEQISRMVGRARTVSGSAVAVALITGVALGGTLAPGGSVASAQTKPVPHGTNMATGMLPADFSGVIERVSPAVVNIQVSQKAAAQPGVPQGMPKGMEEFFKRFFGDQIPEGFGMPEGRPQPGPTVRGLGSGFVIDPDGYIVTNNHVVGEAEKITVTMQNGETYDAKLIGKDPETDLALVKVEARQPLPYVQFSEGAIPRPGQWVIAVGNPFGLDHTATAGIVSATGRAIGAGPYDDFIQIDAPINKGNSGGPTFDLKGEVVGVNTAIFSPSGGSVGIGFAIPSSIARDVISQLREHGSVERGWLGVEIQGVTPDIADTLDLDRAQGAIVTKVMPNGPASAAGLKQGDVVLSVNGQRVSDVRDLSRGVAGLRPGSKANLELLRNGERKTISVTLGTRPSPEQLASRGEQPGDTDETSATLGMKLTTLDEGARQAYGIDGGVSGALIAEVAPDSPAAEKGLSSGDVIVSIANQPVGSATEAKRQIEQAKAQGRKSVLILVRTNGADRFVALPVG